MTRAAGTAAGGGGSAARASGMVRVASLAALRDAGCTVVHAGGHTLALFPHDGRVFAVDNRCPHMGFPLSRGTVGDCILTCHWHHARFDLETGGTLDPWADDVRVFPVELRGDDVWVDLTPRGDALAERRLRLREGLERDIPLVVAKSVIHLLEAGENPREAFAAGLIFGCSNRAGGWGQGLTILTCMINLLPRLERDDHPLALYQGLAAVAQDCAGQPPRFALRPLPGAPPPGATLRRWFRRFVEVRDGEGAERCLASAIAAGADQNLVADMLFAAATDHRYIRGGHVLDFTNKALEALDAAGWEHAAAVLPGLATQYAEADRMEESSAWRHPVDLVAILEGAFESLPAVIDEGAVRGGGWSGEEALSGIVLGDDPEAIVEALLEALRRGAAPQQAASAVAHAAALRICRFHTANEFFDWDRALHTFSFANAVHQGLRRCPSTELLRGVFDAAMSVHLDRFLNVPPARLPGAGAAGPEPEALLRQLPELLDRRQQVDEAGAAAAAWLAAGGGPRRLTAVLGRLLLREDRDFHTIQAVEAAFRQIELAGGGPGATCFLVAAARYLAAHSATARAAAQTFDIARRLHRGDRLYEGP